DFKKVYRAKTPRTQRKLFFLAPLRLCARHSFSDLFFKYLWLVLFDSVISVELIYETNFVELIKDSIVYHILRLNISDPWITRAVGRWTLRNPSSEGKGFRSIMFTMSR